MALSSARISSACEGEIAAPVADFAALGAGVGAAVTAQHAKKRAVRKNDFTLKAR
jgi:hypothetical protein